MALPPHCERTTDAFSQISVIFSKAGRLSPKNCHICSRRGAYRPGTRRMGRKFSKYHGAGNDFVMIDGRTEPFDATPERVAALCRRRTPSIGADGLMILESDPAEEFRMRYFNADGGEATMCGNGGRRIALVGPPSGHRRNAEALHRRRRPPYGRTAAGRGSRGRDTPRDDRRAASGGTPRISVSRHRLAALRRVRRERPGSRRRRARRGDTPQRRLCRPRRYERQLRRDRFRRPYPHKDFRAGRRGRDARLRQPGATASAIAAAVRTEQPVPGLPGPTSREARSAFAFEPDGKGGFTRIELTGPARKVFEGEFADDFRRDGEPEFPKKS